MTSTRLPGKVLKEVLGRPLLAYQIERLRRVRNVHQIVLATTVRSSDEPLIEFCSKESIPCFRGSEEDVLSRYHGAAQEFNADIVVRITSDCPLIDPAVVEAVIEKFVEVPNSYDYVSNSHGRRTFPRGMDTEVFSLETLQIANNEASANSDREHVTPFFYNNPKRFRLGELWNSTDESHHRWTVDTLEDYALVSRLIEYCYPKNPHFTMADLLEASRLHPDWSLINQRVRQKEY